MLADKPFTSLFHLIQLKSVSPTKMPLILNLTSDQNVVSCVRINLKCCLVILVQQSLSRIHNVELLLLTKKQQTLSDGTVGALVSLLSLDLGCRTCGNCGNHSRTTATKPLLWSEWKHFRETDFLHVSCIGTQ